MIRLSQRDISCTQGEEQMHSKQLRLLSTESTCKPFVWNKQKHVYLVKTVKLFGQA